ncbi:MAG: GerMN domain-containing protein, partial [Spirochaetaceae bacterium]|nr:GerMN domain-containing protein [Spirochaetaceae bacterium]
SVMADKNNSSVALFCVVFGAIILSVFAMNLNRIKEVLEETHFVESVFGNSQKETAKKEPESKEVDVKTEIDFEKVPEPVASENVTRPLQTVEDNFSIDITTVSESSGKEDADPLLPETTPAIPSIAEKTDNALPNADIAEAPPKQEEKHEEAAAMRDISLYFMYIDATGNLIRKETHRSIPATSSPLTATLQTLLAGTSIEEESKGYISLIPDGTVLLSASVKNKVAYLNFNDAFQWNKYGVEGYFGQLIQIVYTATTFESVDSVQFLIEGMKQDYLGSEGVWIGSPLSRASLK